MNTEALKLATKNLSVNEMRMYLFLSAEELKGDRISSVSLALHRVHDNLESHINSKRENLQQVMGELRARGLTDEQITENSGVKVRKQVLEGLYALLIFYRQELEDLEDLEFI